MCAPFGAGVLIGPRRMLAAGDQSLLGSGAAPVLDLDDVTRIARPEREEPGSPNVIGAVALGAAIGALGSIGWPAIIGHDVRIARSLRRGLAAIPGCGFSGQIPAPTPCRSPRSPWTASPAHWSQPGSPAKTPLRWATAACTRAPT